MKKLYIFMILILAGTSLFAQTTFSIRGKVLEKKSKAAISQASIRVMNAKDSSFVTGGVSNDNGSFSINTKPGNYIVSGLHHHL